MFLKQNSILEIWRYEELPQKLSNCSSDLTSQSVWSCLIELEWDWLHIHTIEEPNQKKKNTVLDFAPVKIRFTLISAFFWLTNSQFTFRCPSITSPFVLLSISFSIDAYSLSHSSWLSFYLKKEQMNYNLQMATTLIPTYYLNSIFEEMHWDTKLVGVLQDLLSQFH